jgi:hypothetical protein
MPILLTILRSGNQKNIQNLKILHPKGTPHTNFAKERLNLTHTEKIRNTTCGCRLWEVENSGCENSSPTEVKRAFIYQNLSIFITKSMRNICQTKSCLQNQRTYIKALELLYQIYVQFIFHLLQSFLHLWLMKFSMPEKWTYLTR